MPASSRSIYFENSVGRIWEQPKGYLLLAYHPGPRQQADFQALLSHLIRAMQRTGWNRVLVDQREMEPFSSAEQAWMIDEWLPRAVEEGNYQYGAVLLAQDVFARLAMNQVVLATRTLPHVYQSFDNKPDAVKWLLAQK